MAKRGRPKKDGPREPNGRLKRNQALLPPAFDQPGLAVSIADFVPREVTEGGQIVGRTVQRKTWLDTLPRGALNGDQVMALFTFVERRDALIQSPGRCTLDRTPTGGGGIEAYHDALRAHSEAYKQLCACLPYSLIGLLGELCAGRRDWRATDIPKLRQAADCLIVALDRRHAA